MSSALGDIRFDVGRRDQEYPNSWLDKDGWSCLDYFASAQQGKEYDWCGSDGSGQACCFCGGGTGGLCERVPACLPERVRVPGCIRVRSCPCAADSALLWLSSLHTQATSAPLDVRTSMAGRLYFLSTSSFLPHTRFRPCSLCEQSLHRPSP